MAVSLISRGVAIARTAAIGLDCAVDMGARGGLDMDAGHCLHVGVDGCANPVGMGVGYH